MPTIEEIRNIQRGAILHEGNAIILHREDLMKIFAELSDLAQKEIERALDKAANAFTKVIGTRPPATTPPGQQDLIIAAGRSASLLKGEQDERLENLEKLVLYICGRTIIGEAIRESLKADAWAFLKKLRAKYE